MKEQICLKYNGQKDPCLFQQKIQGSENFPWKFKVKKFRKQKKFC